MPGVGAGVGHVHFMFFVLISFAFCSQRKPSFRWNMGFKCLIMSHYDFILNTIIFERLSSVTRIMYITQLDRLAWKLPKFSMENLCKL